MAAAGLFAGLYHVGAVRFNYPDRNEFPVWGLDVSHHQGKIDWAAIPKDQFRFAYIKATEGGDFVDSEFGPNWAKARKASLAVGAYHFFTLCRSGEDQARNFIKTVPASDRQLPPVADLEFMGNCANRPKVSDFGKEYQRFSDLIFKNYKVRPIIYATYEFLEAYSQDLNDKDRILWIRDIVRQPSMKWQIWQFANNGRVPGIPGGVDLNVFNGSEAELQKLSR